MRNYMDLTVWQKSMDLVSQVYQIVERLPQHEQYALALQTARAVVSIPSNIAEGSGRSSKKDFVHFLYIARGSLYEVETQLLVMVRLGYVTDVSDERLLISEIAKMLSSLIRSLSGENQQQL